MSDKPLFEGMDEKERELAPQQVPDIAIPEVERDRGGTASSGPAVAGGAGDVRDSGDAPDRANIAGAEGDPRTAPIVGVRPDVSANTPIMTPATDAERRVPEDDTAADRA